jgi:hypothetical protein
MPVNFESFATKVQFLLHGGETDVKSVKRYGVVFNLAFGRFWETMREQLQVSECRG